MAEQTIVHKGDFVEIKYTGYANKEIFDSNIKEDLKKLNPEAKEEKTVIAVGEGMLVRGLDNFLDGKEIGREYEVDIKPKDGFGERKKELVRTMPLKLFTEQKLNPQAGMILTMNNSLVKVIAVSGARVTVDFNHPMSSKELKYRFTLTRKVTDDKEKAEAVFKFYLQFVPEIEAKDKIVVKGPKILEGYIDSQKELFKRLIGKDLAFEVKELEHKHDHEDHEHSHHDHSHEGHSHEDHDLANHKH